MYSILEHYLSTNHILMIGMIVTFFLTFFFFFFSFSIFVISPPLFTGHK